MFAEKKTFVHDLLLILPFVIIAVVMFFVVNMSSKKGSCAVVEINGLTVAEYSLETDGEYVLNGGTNVLVIRDGSVFMKEADCADLVCVKQGAISMSGETIVCLPNKILIRIVDGLGGVDIVL